MISRYLLTTIIAAAALAVAGCEGDDGARGAPGANGNVLGSSNTLPAEHPGNTAVDLATFLQNDGTGTWTVPLNGLVQIDFGTGAPAIANALTWDSDAGEWLIDINGQTVVFDGITAATVFNNLLVGDCPTGTTSACTDIVSHDHTYSTAWFGVHVDGTVFDTAFYGHSGIGTAAANMPTTGTAVVYDGGHTDEYTVEVDGLFADLFQTTSGKITVDFTTGIVTYEQPLITSGLAELTIDPSTATITGNSYTGTIAGGLYDADGSNDPAVVDDQLIFTSGTYSGTFYGPAANETAGVMSASDIDTTATTSTSIGSVTGAFTGL